MEENNITIGGLARMVQKGFEGIAKKEQVENLTKRVGSFEGWTKHRFNSIDTELKAIREQLTGIVYRYEFKELISRVKNLEDLFAINPKKD